mmetsp:Transcript_3488/g.5331  ORF Transcript_3488/g.5331 Transcript_3488/m.5331 type:complete len:100 (-) Transcript_3488:170-469(-)
MEGTFRKVASTSFVVTKTDPNHGASRISVSPRDNMVGGVEEVEISRTECYGPASKFCGEYIVWDLAEGISFVSFAAAIFTATGAGETAEDDGITDAGGF